MTPPTESRSRDLYACFQRLRCLPKSLITLCPIASRFDTKPTFETLETCVKRTLRDYARETKDHIPLLGTIALSRKQEGSWPHCHSLLQNWRRDPDHPIADPAALRRCGRRHGLDVVVSLHEDTGADMTAYVANHMKRWNTTFVFGDNVRTNFDRLRTAEDTQWLGDQEKPQKSTMKAGAEMLEDDDN